MKSQCSWNILIEKFCTTDNAQRECKIIKTNSKTTLKTLNHFYFHVDLGLAGGKGNEKFIDFAEKLFNPKRKKTTSKFRDGVVNPNKFNVPHFDTIFGGITF